MERKTFIDVAKGIAMLLVVMQHTGGILDPGMRLLCKIDIPLFFVCSGYLAYKSHIDILSQLKKNFRRVFVPFVLACVAVCIFYKKNLCDVFLDTSKSGYWFLETLFFMSIIFMLIYRSSRLLIIGGLLIEAALLITTKYAPDIIDNIFGISYMARYFPCLIMGAIMKKFSIDQLPNKWIGVMLVLIAYIGLAVSYSSTSLSFLAHVAGYASVAVLSFIFIKKNTLRMPGKIKVALSYVGRYSLNIYIIHFYITYFNLPISGGIFPLDFIATFFMAIVVTALSIIIGKILTFFTPLDKILTS